MSDDGHDDDTLQATLSPTSVGATEKTPEQKRERPHSANGIVRKRLQYGVHSDTSDASVHSDTSDASVHSDTSDASVHSDTSDASVHSEKRYYCQDNYYTINLSCTVEHRLSGPTLSGTLIIRLAVFRLENERVAQMRMRVAAVTMDTFFFFLMHAQ